MSHPEYVQKMIADASAEELKERLRGERMTNYTYRAVTEQVEALFESVRTLACLQQEAARWAAIHAKNEGWDDTAKAYASVNRRLAELIADELTWESDKEPVDAFGEPA